MGLGLLFLFTLTATVAAMPWLRRSLLARGQLDHPNHRSSHHAPVPRGGGLACAVGIVCGWSASLALGIPQSTVAILAALCLSFVGLVDDRLSLGSGPRLAAQVAIGAAFGLSVDVRWVVPAALIFVLTVNTVNFMDGINGITSLSILVWAVSMTWMGVTYDLGHLAALGMLSAGAALGFLPWNLPVGRIFLGDVGSYLFGALAAAGTVLALWGGVPAGLVTAPLLVYLFDVLSTLSVRATRGLPLTHAHRDHVYQGLARLLGDNHVVVAVFVAALSALLVLIHGATTLPVAAVVSVLLLAGYRSTPSLLRAARMKKESWNES